MTSAVMDRYSRYLAVTSVHIILAVFLTLVYGMVVSVDLLFVVPERIWYGASLGGSKTRKT